MKSLRNKPLLDKVIDTLKSMVTDFELIGARILIAFSGGPDSTCLTHVLSELQNDWKLSLFVFYLDHGMRDEREILKEIEFVKTFAESLRMGVVVEHIPYGEIHENAKKYGRSVEAEARRRRYQKYYAVAEKIKAHYIAVGHNLDDHIETLVMRFFQGVDFTGLAGIPPKRDIIIRPLVYCTRDEILKYLSHRNLAYKSDATNFELDYLRNRVRMILLPVVRKVFDNYRYNLLSLSEKMKNLREYIDEEVSKRTDIRETERGFEIDYDEFIAMRGVLRIQLILRLYNTLMLSGDGPSALPFRFLHPLLDEERLRHAVTILQGYGIQLVRHGKSLFLKRNIVSVNKKGYLVIVESGGNYSLRGTGIDVNISCCSGQGKEIGDVVLSSSMLSQPIVLRSRKSGDTIVTKAGTKSLKKIFNEWKIPLDKRWQVPLLVDRSGVVAVLGTPLGFKNCFKPGVCVEGAHSQMRAYSQMDILKISFNSSEVF